MTKLSLQQALEQGIAPWAESQIVDDSDPRCTIYVDKFPVNPGHLLFVPKNDTPTDIAYCFAYAHAMANESTAEVSKVHFNIGMNIGELAGQTVMYPHIHLIPRYEGDVEDPTGGVRNVIPSRGNYKKGNRGILNDTRESRLKKSIDSLWTEECNTSDLALEDYNKKVALIEKVLLGE